MRVTLKMCFIAFKWLALELCILKEAIGIVVSMLFQLRNGGSWFSF